jgi:hypothetical protein
VNALWIREPWDARSSHEFLGLVRQLERPRLRPDRGSPTRKTIASPDHSDVMVDVGSGLLVSALSNSGFLAAPGKVEPRTWHAWGGFLSDWLEA